MCTAHPIIGWVSPDPILENILQLFANTLMLLEERDPIGESDNTAKMFKKLDEDNDNTYDGACIVTGQGLSMS
jgi:hypothetical protein